MTLSVDVEKLGVYGPAAFGAAAFFLGMLGLSGKKNTLPAIFSVIALGLLSFLYLYSRGGTEAVRGLAGGHYIIAGCSLALFAALCALPYIYHGAIFAVFLSLWLRDPAQLMAALIVVQAVFASAESAGENKAPGVNVVFLIAAIFLAALYFYLPQHSRAGAAAALFACLLFLSPAASLEPKYAAACVASELLIYARLFDAGFAPASQIAVAAPAVLLIINMADSITEEKFAAYAAKDIANVFYVAACALCLGAGAMPAAAVAVALLFSGAMAHRAFEGKTASDLTVTRVKHNNSAIKNRFYYFFMLFCAAAAEAYLFYIIYKLAPSGIALAVIALAAAGYLAGFLNRLFIIFSATAGAFTRNSLNAAAGFSGPLVFAIYIAAMIFMGYRL